MSRFISDHEDTTTTDGKTITVKYTAPKCEIRKVVYVAQESINEIADAVAKRLPTADLSEYCDKLWKTAYERGKAEARPKKGKWMKTITAYPYCSVCDWMPEEDEMVHGLYNFCPNCGARMTEESE